jgi:predicted Rossmann-fold nucleotide-binding protein
MELAEEENFMSKDQSEIWRVVDTPEEVLPAIQMFERKRIDIRNAGKMR